MKRNKHIDKEINWVISLGLILLGLVVLFLSYQAYSFYVSSGLGLLLIGLIVVLLIIASILFKVLLQFFKTKIELTLFQRMKDSKEFEKLIEAFDFKFINTGYSETTLNGYFVTMNNYVMTKEKSSGEESYFLLELFCDCSELSRKEIDAIEYKNFIVTHNSIIKFSTDWFFRFDAKKIFECLNEQLVFAAKYKLKVIKEEVLKSEEYWSE